MLSEMVSTDSEPTGAKTFSESIKQKKSLSRNLKNTKAMSPGSGETSLTPAPQVAPTEKQFSDIVNQLSDSSKCRVSERSNKQQMPSRFSTRLFAVRVSHYIFVLLIGYQRHSGVAVVRSRR